MSPRELATCVAALVSRVLIGLGTLRTITNRRFFDVVPP
jgi:hypothetical protein